jgi:hypothetical protein
MSIENGDFSELLTDLQLLQLRNRPVKILFLKSIKPGLTKPAKPPKIDALVELLNKALNEKLAGKISGKQFKRMRHRVNAAIRAST